MRQPDEVVIQSLSTRGRDLEEAAMVGARAFHHDPFFEFLEPHPIRRARGLALFSRASLSALGSAGQVSGARQPDGRLVGVSAWLPPGTYPLPAANQARQMVGSLRALALRPPALRDGLRYLFAIEKAHPKEPLWYLLLLVVDPSVQRSGIGTRLQQDGLRAADRDGFECYLETQKPENLAYYRRSGYEVDQELHPVPGGPPLWTMRRAWRAPEPH
jgi:GNAT superfamily N-acetyltransferase